jgi:hypothetical protein
MQVSRLLARILRDLREAIQGEKDAAEAKSLVGIAS